MYFPKEALEIYFAEEACWMYFTKEAHKIYLAQEAHGMYFPKEACEVHTHFRQEAREMNLAKLVCDGKHTRQRRFSAHSSVSLNFDVKQ